MKIVFREVNQHSKIHLISCPFNFKTIEKLIHTGVGAKLLEASVSDVSQ
jgi:hypothetical protein